MIDTSNNKIQSHSDFIVVGAGAAGSVIAAELSASGAQVLLVESGGPDDAPTIANPSVWPNIQRPQLSRSRLQP